MQLLLNRVVLAKSDDWCDWCNVLHLKDTNRRT